MQETQVWSLGQKVPLEESMATVRGVCNFLGSVSSQQKFEATDVKALGVSQFLDSVTALCYSSVLFRKYRKIHPLGMRACWPKSLEVEGERERKRDSACGRETPGPLAPLFMCFSSPWACPMQLGLARSAVCSTWGPHSGPQTFLCSIFVGFSLPCLLATTILDSFFLL